MKIAQQIAAGTNPRQVIQDCENRSDSVEWNHCIGIRRYKFADNSVLAYKNNGVEQKKWFAIDLESSASIDKYKSWVGQIDTQEMAFITTCLQSADNISQTDILSALAEYVENSGFDVIVNESMGWVDITDGWEGIHLEGQDAQAYIDGCKEIWEQCGDVGLETVYLSQAKAYIDCL